MTACVYQPAAIPRHMHWREKPYCLTFLSVIWGTGVYISSVFDFKKFKISRYFECPPPNYCTAPAECHVTKSPGHKEVHFPAPSFKLQSSFPCICASLSSNAQMGEHRFLASKLPKLNTDKARRKKWSLIVRLS